MERKYVYLQALNKRTLKWVMHKKYNTYEEALEALQTLSAECPEATFRVLDNNRDTHSYDKKQG